MVLPDFSIFLILPDGGQMLEKVEFLISFPIQGILKFKWDSINTEFE